MHQFESENHTCLRPCSYLHPATTSYLWSMRVSDSPWPIWGPSPSSIFGPQTLFTFLQIAPLKFMFRTESSSGSNLPSHIQCWTTSLRFPILVFIRRGMSQNALISIPIISYHVGFYSVTITKFQWSEVESTSTQDKGQCSQWSDIYIDCSRKNDGCSRRNLFQTLISSPFARPI